MPRKQSDYDRGKIDRLAGYYDKWYRYNRQDDGAEYDRGALDAVNSGKCPEHFTLIESYEGSRTSFIQS
jgi:hypothetical protein